MLERYMRQLDLINPEVAEDFPITVIGAGSIGSWTSLCLAKTGFKNVSVYDHDKLEEHNISNQAYSTNQVGVQKVDALNKVLENFGESKFDIYSKKFNKEDSPGELTIFAVDSIQARKDCFDFLLQSDNAQYLIDGRMGLSTMHIYSIDLIERDQISYYKKSLDPDVVEAPCTAKTTMSTALVIAGMIVSRVVNYINDEENEKHEVYNTLKQQQLKLR